MVAVPKLSFEFAAPKTPEAEEKLFATLARLKPLKPEFVSVTYGAGGTTKEGTRQAVTRIRKETGLPPAAHLTCVGCSKEEIDQLAQEYWDDGIRHIVALRGDPPGNTGEYSPHPQGYAYASDLVAGLKAIGDFEVSVAAFPEKHPEARSLESDIDNLKRKQDAGATRAITQYFFNNDQYFRFLDQAQARGITMPIIPGIMPVSHVKQLKHFSTLCGAHFPVWMDQLFGGLDEDVATRNMVSAALAAEQCLQLRKAGIEQFHFYTLNRADLTIAVCRLLGVS